MEIWAIPIDYSVAFSFSEDDLFHDAFYRCEVTADQPRFGGIARALEKTTVSAVGEKPDIRWGIVFFDHNDNRKSSFFVGHDMNTDRLNAKIGGQLVKVDKPLIRWLIDNVPFEGCVQLRPT